MIHAALPVPYRTTERQPTFFNLDDNHGCAVPSPHGRTFPRASRYSENMKKHFLYGDDEQLATHITDYGDRA
jgi:hypothetical protein